MKWTMVSRSAAFALLVGCGGTSAPGGNNGNTDGGPDDAPSGLAPCDGTCRITFASGSDWAVYDNDPATNPSAVKLGMAQPICLNASAPPSCPAGALIYGVAGTGWTLSLLTVPGAVWIWGPGIAASDVSDLKRFFFVKTFILGNAPSGRVSIAADDSAEMRVNGNVVDSVGSVTDINEASIANSTLTTFDIAPSLVSGTNTITLAAQNGPPSYAGCATSCTYAQNPAGVVFGGLLEYR